MLRSKLSTSVTAALLLGMVSLTGCGTNNSANSTDVQPNSVRGTHDGRIQVNSARNNNSYDKMEMSQELADRVAAMPEVSTANVMVVGTSAYVAVKLDETNGKPNTLGTNNRTYNNGNGLQNNTSGTGGPMTNGMNAGNGTGGRGTVNGTPGMTGMGGSMNGIPQSNTGTGTVGGAGTANPGAYPGNGGNGILSGSNYTDGTRMKRDIDDSMGTGIGTRSVAPNNSYQMNDNNDLTTDMKDRIASVVRKQNTGIRNVYVSANPDFVERADYYAQEFRAGHPLKGFAKEFGTMVERIFPTRSGY
ncbi:YhcN/YlaJ family sporulation lipoprotein [Paenibacillus tianjinensis]|uniref:YhcN/YlaJ family sporulation lipoprotein n=1 Tax=Paenibacillus tianjinensis TaxID=2810347 RepID=A0ABX7L7M7_9BACL|nr:YhcN/YlaJ family sporulation lipoprotein [Paenibacillus tianjinensis]QSF44210.1 YhcN/YlaJ family sporulation lipoprotein [Paenibacillus tianjinensis]